MKIGMKSLYLEDSVTAGDDLVADAVPAVATGDESEKATGVLADWQADARNNPPRKVVKMKCLRLPPIGVHSV
jgi:hypothetical protein